MTPASTAAMSRSQLCMARDSPQPTIPVSVVTRQISISEKLVMPRRMCGSVRGVNPTSSSMRSTRVIFMPTSE